MTKPPTQSAAAQSSALWHRLSPLAIIHFAVKFILGIAKQGVQAFIPIIAVLATTGDNRWLILGAIGVAAVLFVATFSILSYLRFRYRVDGTNVLIQSGVLTRKRLSVSFDRTQNITFSEPLYFRPFSLVILGLESAGSAQEEVSLAGINRQGAEELRTLILSKQTKQAPIAPEMGHTEEQEPKAVTTIIRQPISELIRYGLTNNNIWVFAGLAIGAIAQVDFEDFAVSPSLEDTINNISEAGQLFLGSILILFILLVAALLMLVSVIGAIFVYYDFHLTADTHQFHRTKGLLERQETSVKFSKVQSLVFNKPWPARLLSRYHILVRQVGFGAHTPHQNGNRFIIPSVTDAFLQKFSAYLYPAFRWSDKTLEPIDAAFTRKYLVWVSLPLVITAIASAFLMDNLSGLFLLAVPLALWPILELRRRQYGYGTDGHHALIRTGFIGHKLTVFAFYKVQALELTQTPGQRRAQLATLHIKLAGNSVTIPYIPLRAAKNWRDMILHRIETSKLHWM